MPIKICLEPGCPEPITGKGRCDTHRKPIERERSRRRREATKGVYKTRMWESRRNQVLARDPFCADGRVCGGRLPSTQVDHVNPLDNGGDPYKLDGLRGTCTPCHEAKTALENAGHTPAQVEAHRQANREQAKATPLIDVIRKANGRVPDAVA